MLGFPLSPKRQADFCFKPIKLFISSYATQLPGGGGGIFLKFRIWIVFDDDLTVHIIASISPQKHL